MSDFQSQNSFNLSSLSTPKGRPDLRRIGIHIHELITPGSPRIGYKERIRRQTVELKPDKRYRQGQVAAILNESYDTAGRRMLKMKGCVDLGSKPRRYKRGKRMLVISGKDLLAYLRSKALE